MGIVDAFKEEDRVQVKFTDFYRIMKQCTQAEMAVNGLKAGVAHDDVLKVLGEYSANDVEE